MPQGILLDDNNDLQFANGGLVIGDINEQLQVLNLVSEAGDAKDYYQVGVGLIDYINSDNIPGLLSRTRVSLVKDGAKVNTVKYLNGRIEIDAQY
jgi:hypothetical protein